MHSQLYRFSISKISLSLRLFFSLHTLYDIVDHCAFFELYVWWFFVWVRALKSITVKMENDAILQTGANINPIWKSPPCEMWIIYYSGYPVDIGYVQFVPCADLCAQWTISIQNIFHAQNIDIVQCFSSLYFFFPFFICERLEKFVDLFTMRWPEALTDEIFCIIEQAARNQIAM